MHHKLSIIIPAWGTAHRLAETLPLNWDVFASALGEIILCGDRSSAPHLLRTVQELMSASNQRPSRILILDGGDNVSKTIVANQGFLQSEGKQLIFSDADIVWTLQSLDEFMSVIRAGRVAHARKVQKYPSLTDVQQAGSPASSSLLVEVRELAQFCSSDGRIVTIQKSAIFPRDTARSGPGIIGIDRTHFESVGGYNGDLRTYGWEDIDIVVRVGLFLGVASEAVAHIYEFASEQTTTDMGARLISEASNYQACLASYCIGILQGTLTNTPPYAVKFDSGLNPEGK